ncbi:malto-oligosyltrehalose synthase [Streptomyces sp. NRRL S-87]|uniref:alpha-amylase family glycosyl hydrolase n=1 Tax=Streptomyces sp. NRRL S-87 TaxID=1463920 RepID=UPI0004C2B204|nr:malto-oligosyltrehalose synthase [Streptomyces sp. NRRL S-87]
MTEQYANGSSPPTATYRLQLQPEFPFEAARAAVPYLAGLGVSHLHLSPVLEAVPGSAHGYDVVDHTRVREELGGERGLRRLADTARRHGLGIVLDIVPNHMAVPAPARLNRPLWEVLKEGQASPYARWFDIDWAAGDGRLLLPVLGDEAVGPDGAVRPDVLRVADGVLGYGPHEFPLREGTGHLPPAELTAAQWYRLGSWRLARTRLNYRRFFTVSELIGVRVEDPEVFRASHDKVLELVRDGVVAGLRIDHPDGLADPGAYLRRLRSETGGRVWTVVEKILAREERLPADWPVAGTTGYDALYRLDGLLTDGRGAGELASLYRGFTGLPSDRGGDWQPTAARAAAELLTHDLVAEVETLVRLAQRARRAGPAPGPDGDRSGPNRHANPPVSEGADTTTGPGAEALRSAVRGLLAALPVYRPYPGDGSAVPPASAVPGDPAAVALVRRLALGDDPAFQARFAQTSAALRAKSLEDRAFYRHAPLLSATEVGGDPGRPAVPAAEFHAYCVRIARDWPGTGTVLSTHDTKRSGDVRARLALLAECPRRWRDVLAALPEGPDRQVVWVTAQTVFGLAAREPERVAGAVLKAVREAGLRTRWTDPDEAYEAAVRAYAEGADLAPVLALAAELAAPARANVLSAALLQLTVPGVPELYQGCEAEYLALVDPDNRAPARFPARFPDPAPDPSDGPPRPDLGSEKRALTRAALLLRRDRPEAFGPGGAPGRPAEGPPYAPLPVRGPAAAHCVAFCRGGAAITVATRLPLGLSATGGWHDTEVRLPPGPWTPVFPTPTERDTPTDPSDTPGPSWVPVAALLARSPATLLARP